MEWWKLNDTEMWSHHNVAKHIVVNLVDERSALRGSTADEDSNIYQHRDYISNVANQCIVQTCTARITVVLFCEAAEWEKEI